MSEARDPRCGQPSPQGVHEYDWPHWVPVAMAVATSSLATLSAYYRDALVPPDWGVLFLLGLAISPWIIEGLNIELPRWLFSSIVLGASLLLLREEVHDIAGPFLLIFLTAEMVARAPLLEGAIVALASAVVVPLVHPGQGTMVWLVAISIAWGVGFFLRYQVGLVRKLRTAQAGLAERAAADERQRIAREVHDVIAHSLTVTMLHLTAARMAVERGDDQEAADALRDAERLGRQSLADIRRTVGLLTPDGAGTLPPMPTAADIPTLVGDFTSAGLAVDLDVRGDIASLPPATGLALYRIVQESLANVAKHAPNAPSRIVLEANDDVTLEVRNGPGDGTHIPSDGQGVGLANMRERATALGGTFQAGLDGDGWCVRASVPLVTQPA